MREHLRNALLETRQHLLKIKAGKYNEEKEEGDVPRNAPKADTPSSDSRPSDKPEAPAQPSGDMEEFEKEKVEFFRTKRRPKAREAVAGAVPPPAPRRGR